MKAERSAVLHFCNNGQRAPGSINCITKTLVRTVKKNIMKTTQQGTIENRPRKVRSLKFIASDSMALSQWIRRNNEATSKQLAQKLLHHRALNASQGTVQQ